MTTYEDVMKRLKKLTLDHTLNHHTATATGNNKMEYDLTDGTRRRRKFIALKSTQVFLFSGVVLLSLAITVLCIGFLVRYEVETDVWDVDKVSFWQDKLSDEQKIWFDDGIAELRNALRVNWEFQYARNVVIFVAHGVGAAAQAAVRFKGSTAKAQTLIWEGFQHMGHILQPCNETESCDASSIATAFYSGIKTTMGLGGLDATVDHQNCTQSMYESKHIKSLLRLAQERDMRTGFVTTRRVSGPTMAPLYAHTPDTSWECDSSMPAGKQLQGCKDIATQLIDDETGGRINVVMGGGRQTLVSNPPSSIWDPFDANICKSTDGRNYLRHWRNMKTFKQQSNALLQNAPELVRLNGSKVDYVLGIFANGNLTPPWLRKSAENHMPELADMVVKGLQVLKRPDNGFLLIVESGNGSEEISQQIMELQRLNGTIHAATELLSSDTLLIVVLNSAQSGLKGNSNDSRNSSNKEANNPSLGTLTDINVFARGPGSHLLQGIYDETYLAHAVTLALKMGQFQEPESKDF